MNTRLLKIKEVVEISRLSRSQIYLMVKENKFPKQIKLNERACAWVKEDVEKWVDDKINGVEVSYE